MRQPKKILVLETVQEEGSESFDEDSLDVEDMTLLAMKFTKFLKFSKTENKKKLLDLVSNPVRVPEIGNYLRGKKKDLVPTVKSENAKQKIQRAWK